MSAPEPICGLTPLARSVLTSFASLRAPIRVCRFAAERERAPFNESLPCALCNKCALFEIALRAIAGERKSHAILLRAQIT